jgi:hypothetical protein
MGMLLIRTAVSNISLLHSQLKHAHYRLLMVRYEASASTRSTSHLIDRLLFHLPRILGQEPL